jgi:hypothetical protein
MIFSTEEDYWIFTELSHEKDAEGSAALILWDVCEHAKKPPDIASHYWRKGIRTGTFTPV